MNRPIKLSVLIPSIFERINNLKELTWRLRLQMARIKREDVELVSVVDNCVVSIGHKRQAVLDVSHGDYVAFVDDDDDVTPRYVEAILTAIDAHPSVDVITFNNYSYINSDKAAEVIMRLKQPNEGFNPVRFNRAAWHTCAWRSGLAKRFSFPDSSYGEDWAWASQLNDAAISEHHLDEFLHIYRFSSKHSRADNVKT